MNVLEGPRRERRRVLHGGPPAWVTVDGDELVLGDGRSIAEASATYPAPCEPTKIPCIDLNYDSWNRSPYRDKMLAGQPVFVIAARWQAAIAGHGRTGAYGTRIYPQPW